MKIPDYYKGYTEMAGSEPIKQRLERQSIEYTSFLQKIPEDHWNRSYADGKWTVKELVLHVTDTERIFSYRVLRMARHDRTPLPGFDQDEYVPVSGADQREPASLIEEFRTVRSATISLFRSFTPEIHQLSGTASGGTFDVEGLGKVIIGHLEHHTNVLKERYQKVIDN